MKQSKDLRLTPSLATPSPRKKAQKIFYFLSLKHHKRQTVKEISIASVLVPPLEAVPSRLSSAKSIIIPVPSERPSGVVHGSVAFLGGRPAVRTCGGSVPDHVLASAAARRPLSEECGACRACNEDGTAEKSARTATLAVGGGRSQLCASSGDAARSVDKQCW